MKTYRPNAVAMFVWSCLLIVSGSTLVYGLSYDFSVPKQLGALGFIVVILYSPLLFASRKQRLAAVRLTVGLLVFAFVFFTAGEMALRLLFLDGETFSSHGGALVRRFEKDFRLNHFDGPSRGPEVFGPKSPGVTRVVVQGDSITWGQGVKDEEHIFTSRLLTKIREEGANVDMAVLAQPGRDIDGHIDQLTKWGKELSPDIILYQWYYNDMGAGKNSGPRFARTIPFWRRFFFHRYFVNHSYLWFFLDYNLGSLLPSRHQENAAFISTHFSETGPGWQAFTQFFREWSRLAKSLTPRVLVAIYPDMSFPKDAPPDVTPEMLMLHERLRVLCSEEGIRTVDFTGWLTVFENAQEIMASRYDAHPSAQAHAVLSEALYKTLSEYWPDSFLVPDGGQVSSRRSYKPRKEVP